MIKRRWKAFSHAHALLEELRVIHAAGGGELPISPRLIVVLTKMYRLLIREISRTERKIRRTKSILKELDTASEISELAAERLEEYRHLRYSWLCFGDAVAFLFMDKYALKQTYFNTHNTNAKQDAGFLGNKTGLKHEIEFLDKCFNKGIPALLSDLTNTIRHGDVCVMIRPDPILVEVKSGARDGRGQRQRKEIQQLMNFFKTDEAEGLRGLSKIVRVAHETPEVTYIKEFNDCIRAALRNGVAWLSPEDGLFYVAIARNDIDLDSVLSSLPLRRPTVFPLNEIKSARAWAPYSPFTLSIRERDALFGFIWGEIYLLVIYETDTLRQLAEAKGFMLTFPGEESENEFEISLQQNGGKMGLRKQMFERLAMDFTSPAWLLHTAIEHFNRHQKDTTKV